MKQTSVCLSIFLFPTFLISQIVCYTTDGKPCPPDPEMKYCREEVVTPNLSVAKAAHVSGILVEEKTDLPMVFKSEIMQLRDPKSMVILISVSVSENGLFDLGVVPAGEYRLLAVRKKADGSLERLPEIDQPNRMVCTEESDCKIYAVQHIHGTDWLYEFCPPK
jgi:hypothetical protein